jgi:hypothetical protein
MAQSPFIAPFAMSGRVAYTSTLRCRNHEPPLRELTTDNCPPAFAYNYLPFVHTIEEKGSAMEMNPQQQKQGAALPTVFRVEISYKTPNINRITFLAVN